MPCRRLTVAEYENLLLQDPNPVGYESLLACGGNCCFDCPPNACSTEVQPGQCCPASGDWQQGRVALVIDACDPVWTVTEGPPPTESYDYNRVLIYDGWSWEMEMNAPPEGFGLTLRSTRACEGSVNVQCGRLRTSFYYDIEVDGVVVVSNTNIFVPDYPACKVPGGTSVKVRIWGLRIDANSDWTGGSGQTQGRWALSDVCWLWYGRTDVPPVSAFRAVVSCDKCAFSQCDCVFS